MTVDVSMTGVRQGSVTFQGDHVITDPSTTPSLKEHLERLQTSGLTVYQDHRVGMDHVMVSAPIRRDDPNYALGFIQALERMGYDVVQRHPEVDAQIHHLAAQLPEGHPSRQKLHESLPTMTHLEKTYIRDALRQLLDSKQSS